MQMTFIGNCHTSLLHALLQLFKMSLLVFPDTLKGKEKNNNQIQTQYFAIVVFFPLRVLVYYKLQQYHLKLYWAL